MQGLILFAVVLSVLVVVHEWGHYYAAKKLGVRVERFSIGFGPILFRLKPKETEFCFSLIPLGGYVKMAGENPDEATGAPWEFHTRENWEKFIIVFAGPLLNAIMAIVLFFTVFASGYPTLTTRIGEVTKGYPAAEAGVASGDRITSINNKPVETWEELVMQIQKNDSPTMKVTVDRKGEVVSYDLQPKSVQDKDALGRSAKMKRIGVTPAGDIITVKNTITDSVWLSITKFFGLCWAILVSLWMLITGALSFKESMAGPIGIYYMTQDAAQVGMAYLLDFMGRLSTSLCIINLLPIPVLDGGHIFFILIESITGRKISDNVKDWALRIGLVLILALTVFVIIQDVQKFGIVDKVANLFR